MDYKWVCLQAFYPVNTGYPVQWGGGCIRSSADCNTSTVWPWHQLIWFGVRRPATATIIPFTHAGMAKHDYLLEAAWSWSPSLTRSYITCLDFYSHAVSFTVICWHDLDIFKPVKLFIQKSFWNTLNIRITSQTQIKKTISVSMYHQGYIWPQKGVGTCKSSVQWRFILCVWFGKCFGVLHWF